MVRGVDLSLSNVKEEMDDHLTAINENTQEIELCYSHMMEMNKRIKFLENKIDFMQKIIAKLVQNEQIPVKSEDKPKIRLSKQEQKLFMQFYSFDGALDLTMLCAKLARSDGFIRYYINSLIQKGVPILKENRGKKQYFLLDPQFKDEHARNNLVLIERDLSLDNFDQGIM